MDFKPLYQLATRASRIKTLLKKGNQLQFKHKRIEFMYGTPKDAGCWTHHSDVILLPGGRFALGTAYNSQAVSEIEMDPGSMIIGRHYILCWDLGINLDGKKPLFPVTRFQLTFTNKNADLKIPNHGVESRVEAQANDNLNRIVVTVVFELEVSLYDDEEDQFRVQDPHALPDDARNQK